MKLVEYLKDNHIPYEANVSLKRKTWIKTGGVAALWIEPTTLQMLSELYTYIHTLECCSVEIIGHTSNLFFRNDYNPKVVLSTRKLTKYEFADDEIICECGVPIAKLSKLCIQKGIAGYSGLVGLPGTVAAAVYNNSGAFDTIISEMMNSATLLQPDGKKVELNREELGFSHRSSLMKEKKIEGIILSVKLKKILSHDPTKEIQHADYATEQRRLTLEPPMLNLGCVYASLNMKRSVRTIIYRKLHRFMPRRSRKILYLLYGCADLGRYISDKNINTFIWRDEKAELMFDKYQRFMNQVFDYPKIEIEIKG